MDSLITAAARALAAGDPLGALKRVALRDDAPALALRGIALAQLGDLVRAKALVRRAARAFGAKEAVARARCIVAEAEIALASRDLGWPANALDAARETLEAHGDRVNAAHARYLGVRRLLLIGRLDEAERALADLDPSPFPPASRTAHELVVAGIAMRRVRARSRTRRARPGRARGPTGADSGPDGGSRERGAAAGRAGGAPPCGRRRAAAAARGRRSAARVERARRGRVSSRRASAAARGFRSPPGRCCSRSRGPWRRRGPATSRGTRSWPAHSARRPPTNRIARGCASRSAGSARFFGRWRACRRRPAGFALVPRRARRDRRAGPAGGRGACGGVGLPHRWRVVVELGAGPGARHQPAHRAAGAGLPGRRRQGAVVRSRAGASLDDSAPARIRDDRCYSPPRCLVTRIAACIDQQPTSSANTCLSRRRRRARGHLRRRARLVRVRRHAAGLRSGEREDGALARRRRACRHGLRRPAPVPDRRGSHPQDRSATGRVLAIDSGAGRRRRLGAGVGRGHAVGRAVSRPQDPPGRSRTPARSSARSSRTASSPA